MQKLMLFLGLCLLIAVPAHAQQEGYPAAEVFGGFSYLRAGISEGTNMVGWQGNFSGNLNKTVGIVGDFGGQYKSVSGVRVSAYEYLVGPRFNYRAGKSTAFVHALVGGARAGASYGGASISKNGFAFAAGGGVDIGITKLIAIRPFQLDYVQNRIANLWAHNLRASAGIVFRLGNR